jgi:hypothetical protein
MAKAIEIVATVKKPVIKPRIQNLSIFDKVKNDPKFTPARSIDWFKKKISQLGGNSPTAKTDLFKTTKELQTTRSLPGSMQLFGYDPKYKDTLPFYDMFPLVIVLEPTINGFFGLNLHYLSYEMRRRLFGRIWQIAANNQNSQEQVKRLTWKLLGNVSKFPEVAPCCKRYLWDHLTTKIIKIPVDDWVTAIHLPVEKFAKKSQSYVARNSGQVIRKAIANR